MDIRIEKLSPERVEDFLYFFDNLTFSENPHWASCYCHFNHANCSGEEWQRRTAEDNRKASQTLITEGKMHGFIAYAENKPVGWCHADLRANLPGLSDQCNEEDEKHKIGAIVCFIVAPEYRKQGIAAQLLVRVCNDFRNSGYRIVEAYPRLEAVSDGQNYHGPLRMYTAYGFEQVGVDEGIAIVRKVLKEA